MKKAILGVVFFLALGTCASADTTDEFYVPTAIDGLPATFFLPSTVNVGGSAGQVLTISDIPVLIDGMTVDFDMEFIPENGGTDSGNVLMHCTASFIFCQFSPSIGTTYPDGNLGPFYTFSNGQMTFIPGIYGEVTITDPVPSPEVNVMLLLGIGLTAVRLRRRTA